MIAPVAVFRLSPVGRDGAIANEIGAVPPVVVTGVKDAADDAVRVSDAMANVVERAGEITSANVLALVALVASVAVTV